MLHIYSRKTARERGLKNYFTGEPCKNGHVAERKIGGDCRECASSWGRRYYAANKETMQESARKNYYANQEARVAQVALYRNAKKSFIKERRKEEFGSDEYRHQRKAYMQEYRDRFPEKIAQNRLKRRYQQAQATPSWYGELDAFVMQEAYALAKEREETTGIKWEVDHLIPLRAKLACGLHSANNVQVVPQRINRYKLHNMVLTEVGEWLRCNYD